MNRLLRGQQGLDAGLTCSRRQFGRHLNPRQAIALGHKPGDPGPNFIELLAHHLQTGLRLGRIEPQQQIAGAHPLAVVNRNLRDNPAGRMLDGLYVRLNHKITGNHDGARQRHQHGPAAGQEADDEQHPKSGPQLALEGATGP